MLKRWVPGWAIGLVVVMAVGTVWLRLAIVRTTYSINQTERAIRELRQAREQMQLKVTALKSPRRLEVLARSKFNLGTPRSDQVVYMGAGYRPAAGAEPGAEDAVVMHQAAPVEAAKRVVPAPQRKVTHSAHKPAHKLQHHKATSRVAHGR